MSTLIAVLHRAERAQRLAVGVGGRIHPKGLEARLERLLDQLRAVRVQLVLHAAAQNVPSVLVNYLQDGLVVPLAVLHRLLLCLPRAHQRRAVGLR